MAVTFITGLTFPSASGVCHHMYMPPASHLH